MARKKPGRKKEPTSERGIAWPRWTGFRGMTVRDWLQLLIVPFALVVIGFLFTMQQEARQQAIEDQRARAERELQEQRAQDAALEAYLQQMGQLVLERNLPEAEENDPVYALAHARTRTILSRLDAEQSRTVTRFLTTTGLMGIERGGRPTISLLANIELRDAILSDADLSGADLSGADLRSADLSGADLSGADLSGADLSDADLRFANMSDAILSGAELSGADLSGAILRSADLSGAILRSADLSEADLFDADLSFARGVTEQQLEEQAKNLEGATMPDGSIHGGVAQVDAADATMPDGSIHGGVAQVDAAANDGVLTVGQCIEANDASVAPLEKALIEQDIIEDDLLQTKVTNGTCEDMLAQIPDGTPVRRFLAAQNYIQEIKLIEEAMRRADGEAAAKATNRDQAAAAASAAEDGDASIAERLRQKEAALKKAGASVAEARAGARCSTEVEVSDDEIKKSTAPFEIIPQMPKAMRLGETEQAGFLVTPATKETFEEIRQKHGVIAEVSESGIGCVDLVDRMKAQLVPLDLEGLAIYRHHPDDIRELSSNRDARWGWDITARQTGNQGLLLDLRYAISREGQEFRLIPDSPMYEGGIWVTREELEAERGQGFWRRLFGG